MNGRHDLRGAGKRLTRRKAFAAVGPLLLCGDRGRVAADEPRQQPARPGLGGRLERDLEQSGRGLGEELLKSYTPRELEFLWGVIDSAWRGPGKADEPSYTAYCRWLIGSPAPRKGAGLRLIHGLITFSDDYPKERALGVISTGRLVNLQDRRSEGCEAIARVRSPRAEPRAVLTAAVEERTKADEEEIVAIYHATKRFLHSDATWNLLESHVTRVG
jgi:hypothetical protein